MSQSSLLVGLLAATFLLYVAAKGRLPAYTSVLWGKVTDTSGGDGKSGGVNAKDAIKLAVEVAPYVLA